MGGGVAVVGAGGFVGARFLERGLIEGRTDLVPIVRAVRSVGRIAELGIPYRVADASDARGLARALDGCDAVVNLTKGSSQEILETTKAIHAAATAAGARVLVHLSSAAVYGDLDGPDLPDDAPPRIDLRNVYARQKALAEIFLRQRIAEAGPAIVVLRPSLIWGPGSPWVLGPATDLVQGRAYLVGDGSGICNLSYVDNLVNAVRAVVDHPAPARGFYHVADDETTTWREYFGALSAGLGLDPKDIHRVPDDRFRPGLKDRLGDLQSLALYGWLKDRVSKDTRAAIKLRLARRAKPGPPAQAAPSVSREMWHLQMTRYALPATKLASAFGHQNTTSFSSGIAASLAWLEFLGLAMGEPSTGPQAGLPETAMGAPVGGA